MSIHQQDENRRSDCEFQNGTLELLKEGNLCRLLDGRRTTGYIESLVPESAMFRWRITQYEDTGKYWDLPYGAVKNFQFELNASKNNERIVEEYEKLEDSFSLKLDIERQMSQYEDTEKEIETVVKSVKEYLEAYSEYFIQNTLSDTNTFKGSEWLFEIFEAYMKTHDLFSEELKTQMLMVLNPDSGEWIKGLKIVAAEMGLTAYHGTIPRTKDIFEGRESKENRKRYIVHRMAFIRAYFEKIGFKEVVLYRGMATEGEFKKVHRSILACTFNRAVAESFSSLYASQSYRNGYIVKMTTDIRKLFMTYHETRGMNNQYEEAEGVIFYNDEIVL